MKNQSNNILFGVIILVAVMNLFLLLQIKDKNRTIHGVKQEAANHLFKSDQQLQILENVKVLSKMQHYIERKPLGNLVLYKMVNDSLFLNDILDEDNKLFFFFSCKGCAPCYEPFLKKLDELAKEVGSDRIVVLAEFFNNRDLKSFWSYNNLNVYRINSDLKVFPSKSSYALAFLLNKDRFIENVIIVDKSNIQLTDDYLKVINKYFL